MKDWEELLETIDTLLENDDYCFALSTLEGIKSYVTMNEKCTDKQVEAVDNIIESAR